MISTVTEPLLTSLNSSSSSKESAEKSSTPGTPLLEGTFPPFDSLTLRTTKGGRRLSVPVSDLAFHRGPSTPYQRPKLFSFLNDSPSFFGLQEEDGENHGQGDKAEEDGVLKENGNDQIITPKDDDDDDDNEEEKRGEQENEGQTTSTSASFDNNESSATNQQQQQQNRPPRSILKKDDLSRRFFAFGDFVRLLKVVPVEGGLMVTLLCRRGLAKWRWAVETIRLKTEDIFEQLVVKSL